MMVGAPLSIAGVIYGLLGGSRALDTLFDIRNHAASSRTIRW